MDKDWFPWGKNRPPTGRSQGTGVGSSSKMETRVDINPPRTAASKRDAQDVEIDFTDCIQLVSFLDGKHVVSADALTKRGRFDVGE